MFAALLVPLFLPFIFVSRIRSSSYRPFFKIFFWIFIGNYLLLTWIGGQPVEDPYITIGQFLTFFYFSYFLILTPLLGFLDNLLFQIKFLSIS